ncbi:Allantoicase, variant 2 [Entomophthora muscae]|uniref:Allantoicase, variant 2 n=1 Tax=Entomophthora muscae TaxID=34485 RepID=A0ACC2RVA1_9FUNG|nr:Allantoicase, variant 2 [Entomophthora muscae]
MLGESLSAVAFSPYGDVIELPSSKGSSANQGTAQRFNHLTKITSFSRPSKRDVSLNTCIFHAQPRMNQDLASHEKPLFEIKLLERHKYSTQLFLPYGTSSTASYLVIVCLNGKDDKPDLSTLKAFTATYSQGINYHPGIWHHPMVALNNPMTFFCQVHENGVLEEDTEEILLSPTLSVEVWSQTDSCQS